MHVAGLFLTWVLLAAPLASEAQSVGRMSRIGVLLTLYSSPDEDTPQAFRDGLRALGYIEGKNIAIEWRSAKGQYDQVAALAEELVRLKVDVILADVTPTTRAARQATATIPIVIMVGADPVGNGLVASLAHPGGNVTGLSIALPEIGAKRLQLLTQVIPEASRVAVLWNPRTPYHTDLLKEVEAAAPLLRLHVVPIAVRGPDEFEGAFAAMAQARVNALYVADDAMFFTSRRRLIELANKARLPTVFAHRGFVTTGGLLSYGPSLSERFRLAATYVDKILKGAKPADLPVDQAAKLEFVINRKTAAALGLTIPQPLLLRADEIIQ